MATMQALTTSGEGQPATVQSVPRPIPSRGEILIKVTYVGQNPADLWSTAGATPGLIVGCDFAGTVADANGSSLWQKGQRVAGWVFGASEGPRRGAFAEYLVTEETLVFAIPDEISDQQAAVISLVLTTAVQALFLRLKLPEPSSSETPKPGIPVLVFGASGGVGKCVVQLAKLAGYYVIGTGSKRNHEEMKALGADVVLDYNDPNWPEQVRELTKDQLAYAVDCVSAHGSTQATARAMSVGKGGKVICLLNVYEIKKSGEINKKVVLESTVAYTVLRGIQGTFVEMAAPDNASEEETKEDRGTWERWLKLLPDLLRSGKFKPLGYRERGVLGDIVEGLKEGQSEKLVYKIA